MKLLVIDGNSLANRSFYGIRPLSNKKGVFTHATTGFFNTYLKLIKKFSPDCCIVAFDMRAKTFRSEIYSEYKAHRKGMPDELAIQLPYIKDILNAIGIPILECEGYEADDILGTLASACDVSGNYCILATGDRDAFQLVTDYVSLNLAKTNDETTFTPEMIKELYGIMPRQMIEVKALMGDSSDNIPGVAGIGEKTAFGLIQSFGSVDYIYENLDSIDIKPAVKNKLEAGKEACYMSRDLGTISTEAPVSKRLEDYKQKETDKDKLSEILTELEMSGLMKKLNISPSAEVTSVHEINIAAEKNLNPELSEYTEIIFNDGRVYAYEKGAFREIEPDKQAEFLSGDTKKRTFNLKMLWNYVFNNFGMSFNIKNVVFDTTLAAYLLNVNANEYTLEKLCSEYGIEYSAETEALGKCLYEINELLSRRIENEKLDFVLNEIELPLAEVLASMENYGIALDIDGVKSFGAELRSDIEILEDKIYELAGVKFNILSPKQLGEVLFDKLMLPSGKKNKTGYSTNADVLEFLMDKHAIIPLISEYRSLTKLNSTYVAGLLKVVGNDGRIHSTFKQTETRTGRISSAEPNIQNIPVRTERGRKMRKFFKAADGKVLADADYSQIELRVLAHISGDKIMQGAFASGEDIHAITASQVFNQPLEWVTPEMRTSAKAVNFGIVYGIGAFSLSRDIGVSVAEADRYIKNYLDKYHYVKDYMESTINGAKKNGWVQTMFGRRRYVPEVNAKNKNIEALGKRIVMNTPIQGTAADIIKLAMIRVYNKLKNSDLNARLILQVHDELIVETEKGTENEVSQILKNEMEAAACLSIPLTVDVKSGITWYETH